MSNAIQKAQQNIESRYFAQRKSTLEYDLVNAVVRDNIYEQRDEILLTDDFSDIYEGMSSKYIDFLFKDFAKLYPNKFNNKTMRKIFYEAPEFEVLDVMVEAGFLVSVDSVESDYLDGGEGDLMDYSN